MRKQVLHSLPQNSCLHLHGLDGIGLTLQAETGRIVKDAENAPSISEPDRLCLHYYPSIGQTAEERAFDQLSCLDRIVVDTFP